MNFKKIAYKIRHNPLLEGQEGLWKLLRKPYHFLIDPFGKGVKLFINNTFFIRVPPSFYKTEYVNYEREAVLKSIEWAQNHPDSIALDIGTAWGYFSSILLHAGKNINVIGVDSDITSLKVSKWVCSNISDERYTVINCLISDNANRNDTFEEAVSLTKKKLNNKQISVNPSDTKYINLGTEDAKDLVSYTIDGLFLDIKTESKVFIKCDIEGAEMLALIGAEKFIGKFRPVMLLSIHPEMLQNYNSNKDEVSFFLKRLGYNIELLAIDHEEHWWCTPLEDLEK